MSELGIGVASNLDSLGQALLARLGPLNLLTGALLGGALVLDRALSRRVRASWRIALYAPVALRILLPLDWSLRLTSAPRVDAIFAPLMQIGASAAVESPVSHAPSRYALAAIAYLAVVTLLAARAVVARVRLSRALAGARPARNARLEAPCPVVQHEDLGPMAVGLLAPRIVLPQRLLAAGEEHALACVLRHESAHLRRRDAWLSAGMQLLAIAAWPVVPVWIAIARVRQLVELACDEAALAGADATERRRYGHALLDIAEWRSLTVTPFGAGELNFGSTLRARIEALASQRHWPLAAQVLTLTLAPAALLAACAAAAPPVAVLPTTGASTADAEDKDYGYKFDVDTTKQAADARAASASLSAGADGRVPPEAIQAAVRARFSALVACYDAGLKKDPKLTGTVTVKLTIGTDGVTKGSEDHGSSLPDADVVNCVVSELGKVTYPAGSGIVTVLYPIEFAP